MIGRELTREQQDRVERAVAFCHDALTTDIQQAAVKQALQFANDEHMRRFLKGRRQYSCESLAVLARSILQGKDDLHSRIGWLAESVAAYFGRPPLERKLAQHLAERIPIPSIDEPLVAVSRGLQMTGIAICLPTEPGLVRCACFIDVVLTEGRERVKSIIATAAGDWAGLNGLTAQGS
ncbi:hypothetical protein ACFO4E_27600 [Nocardiopsis mangrovi]|uniref:Uncharacterized protein n=1 Tax=Nocardiopsis mangrovi TaxID=1179818 RepID=A0ABV9E378_9ACTN